MRSSDGAFHVRWKSGRHPCKQFLTFLKELFKLTIKTCDFQQTHSCPQLAIVSNTIGCFYTNSIGKADFNVKLFGGKLNIVPYC